MRFLGLSTRSRFTTDYPGVDGGKIAYDWVRWVSLRGEKGPWSETASATIGAKRSTVGESLELGLGKIQSIRCRPSA